MVRAARILLRLKIRTNQAHPAQIPQLRIADPEWIFQESLEGKVDGAPGFPLSFLVSYLFLSSDTGSRFTNIWIRKHVICTSFFCGRKDNLFLITFVTILIIVLVSLHLLLQHFPYQVKICCMHPTKQISSLIVESLCLSSRHKWHKLKGGARLVGFVLPLLCCAYAGWNSRQASSAF